ncbi:MULTISPECIES: hypothetical protein [Aeromonas]|uniref:hypothetical protein n=1 Tax=Aeromonas TaxID=642 RepID=UPI002B061190|nr:hypothetical protein [Aeromonas jandaei]
MHQFECTHPYNACKQFDSGLLQKVGVLIVVGGDGKNALGNRELGSFNKEIKELKGRK